MDKLMHIIDEVKAFTPEIAEIPAYEPEGAYAGIQAITYSMPAALGGKYKTFAYIGVPENVKDAPGVVLVHGGNGHAFLEWVKLWNDRGYAAIAMDLEGFYPETKNAGANWTDGTWHHGEFGVFDAGELPSPKNDSMGNFDKPLEKQWMTHAVSKVIVARRILLEKTKCKKIGIVGVSWGAVITALVLGFENRFDFAVPVYGGGFMDESFARLGTFFHPAQNRKYWLAQARFSNLTIPCFWVGWDDDPNFSSNINSLSYEETRPHHAGTRLSLINDFSHSHRAASEREEVYAFADCICKNAGVFPDLVVDSDCVRVHGAQSVLSAKLYYLKSPMAYAVFDKFGAGEHSYMTENWKSTPCEINGNTVIFYVPDTAAEYYIAVETKSGEKILYISSKLYRKTETGEFI